MLDLARLEWAARLAAPTGAKIYDLALSADGKHLAALRVFPNGQQPPKVAVYDLQKQLAAGVEDPLVRPAGALHSVDHEPRPEQ